MLCAPCYHERRVLQWYVRCAWAGRYTCSPVDLFRSTKSGSGPLYPKHWALGGYNEKLAQQPSQILARHCPRLAPTYPQHGLKMSEVRPWAAPKKLPTKRNFRLWNLQDPVLYPKHAADRTKKWPKQTHQRPNNAHDWPIPSKWA